MSNDGGEGLRDMLRRAIAIAESADKLAISTSHNVELLEQRMDSFERLDSERRERIQERHAENQKSLAELTDALHKLYGRAWQFAVTIVGGLFVSAGIIAGVAYWLGQTLGKLPGN